MRISGRRIINIVRHIGHIAAGSQIRILFDATDTLAASLARAGFDPDSQDGATILPAIVGPVTRFNAEGRWITHRDQPKEKRYIGSRLHRWKQWAGRGQTEDHERVVDIERDCYPRTLVPPPSVEITLASANGRRMIASSPFTVGGEGNDDIKHVINLFLEMFRECDVVSQNIQQYEPPQILVANWKFLPPGEYPWPVLRPHIERALRRASEDTAAIIEDRAETIRGYGPDRVIIGQGGFGDYLAYDFQRRGIVILEAIRRDNALYVFGQNWEAVSRLTKAQVLNGNLHLHRIIHSVGWKAQVAQIMNG